MRFKEFIKQQEDIDIEDSVVKDMNDDLELDNKEIEDVKLEDNNDKDN